MNLNLRNAVKDACTDWSTADRGFDTVRNRSSTHPTLLSLVLYQAAPRASFARQALLCHRQTQYQCLSMVVST